jgi:signal transduction histidine kinase
LFIAKHVVEAHGGSLTFESADGWTRFVVSLPRAIH